MVKTRKQSKNTSRIYPQLPQGDGDDEGNPLLADDMEKTHEGSMNASTRTVQSAGGDLSQNSTLGSPHSTNLSNISQSQSSTSSHSSNLSFRGSSQSSPEDSRTRSNTSPSSFGAYTSPQQQYNPAQHVRDLNESGNWQREGQARPQRTAREPDQDISDRVMTFLISKFGEYYMVPVYTVVFIVIGSVFALLLYSSTPNVQPSVGSAPPISRKEMEKFFVTQFKSVEQKFPAQDHRFWQVIRASCKSVLSVQKPTQPAIIMLAASKQHARTSECIAKHITREFTAAYKNAASPGTLTAVNDYLSYTHSQADSLKKHIDQQVRRAFNAGSRAFHVSEVHRIPGRAAAMFHAFCDNDNAPYKDAAIVFTAHRDDPAPIQSDIEVEDFLTEVWSDDLDIDTLTPLLSRIANNIAYVRGEDDSVLNAHC